MLPSLRLPALLPATLMRRRLILRLKLLPPPLRHLQPCNPPPFPLGVFVYKAGRRLERFVYADDGAGDGGEDVRGGFDGFDCADCVALGCLQAVGGELDEDYVAEVFGCVGGYADGACDR